MTEANEEFGGAVNERARLRECACRVWPRTGVLEVCLAKGSVLEVCLAKGKCVWLRAGVLVVCAHCGSPETVC